VLLLTLTIWARVVIATIAGLVTLWLATIGLILFAASKPHLQKSDAILVMGAAQYNGKPSPVFRARLDHAIGLHHQQYAPYLIVTGGVGKGDTLSEGEVGRRYAETKGILPEMILVEREGETSFESIEAAAAIMRQYNLKSALLVSDGYHMLRLELLARRAGIEGHRAPTPAALNEAARKYRWRYVLRESMLFPATAFMGAWR
jgi:uncharacterized SAM-binding protein YcdF (DUF218 family)